MRRPSSQWRARAQCVAWHRGRAHEQHGEAATTSRSPPVQAASRDVALTRGPLVDGYIDPAGSNGRGRAREPAKFCDCCPIAAYCSETAADIGGLQADMNEHRPRSAPVSVDLSGVRWTHSEPLLTRQVRGSSPWQRTALGGWRWRRVRGVLCSPRPQLAEPGRTVRWVAPIR